MGIVPAVSAYCLKHAPVPRLALLQEMALHAIQVQLISSALNAMQPQAAQQTRIVLMAFVWTLDSAPETRRNCAIEFIRWHLAALIIEPSAAPPQAVVSRVVLECQKHQPAALNVEPLVLIHLIILAVTAVPFQNHFAILGPGSTICLVVLELTNSTLLQEPFLANALPQTRVIMKETIPFAATLPPPLIKPPKLWVPSIAIQRVS